MANKKHAGKGGDNFGLYDPQRKIQAFKLYKIFLCLFDCKLKFEWYLLHFMKNLCEQI